MRDRIAQELAVIRQVYEGVEYREEGDWFFVPSYPLPGGWNRDTTEVAFQVIVSYPVQPPYGFYVPMGIRFDGKIPDNYSEPVDNAPPFGGQWGFFSWAPEDGDWMPGIDVSRGTNLLDWVKGFALRFREGG